MLQKEVIDTISPVDSAWKGSSLNFPAGGEEIASRGIAGGGSLENLFLLLSLIAFLLLGCYLYRFIFRKAKQSDLFFGATTLLGAFFLPVLVVELGFIPRFTSSHPLFTEFCFVVGAALSVFLVLKLTAVFSISWLVRDRQFSQKLNVVSHMFFLLFVIAWIFLLIVQNTFSLQNITSYKTVVYAVSASVLLCRYFFLARTLISLKVPIVFSFLYLCTFEFLPLIVMVHLFILLQ